MRDVEISVLVVNRDNLELTVQCIQDLAQQGVGFELILVDNGSSEAGTLERFAQLREQHPFIAHLWVSGYNRPLSEIWNQFAVDARSDLLCFLNNDVRLPPNFLSDTVEVMAREAQVGCVVHSTNHPQFRVEEALRYQRVEDNRYLQGWDFTMRRKAYHPIPEPIRFYFGDDYLFEALYRSGWSLAYCLSSPIIHFESRTIRKSSLVKRDMKAYKRLGYERYLRINSDFSRYYDNELRYSGNRRPEIIEFIPPHYTRVLEIGCADGEFSEKCLDRSAETWTIEPNPMYREILASKGFHRVICDDFFQASASLPDGYFDLVVCNDVIEHMPDHEQFLAAISGKMTKGGYLIGSVPNVRYYKVLREYLFNRRWDYQESGVMDKTHLRWFTLSSLHDSFERHGFRVELLKGINAPTRIKAFVLAMNLLSLGTQRDIKYQQIGFRIKNR